MAPPCLLGTIIPVEFRSAQMGQYADSGFCCWRPFCFLCRSSQERAGTLLLCVCLLFQIPPEQLGIQCLGSEARTGGMWGQLGARQKSSILPVVCLWASHSTTLILGLLFWKMGESQGSFRGSGPGIPSHGAWYMVDALRSVFLRSCLSEGWPQRKVAWRTSLRWLLRGLSVPYGPLL